MNKYKLIIVAFLHCFLLWLGPTWLQAAENPGSSDIVCAVYISGIGCHNCAVTDPLVLTQFTQRYPHFIVFKYEIYKEHKENKEVKQDYFDTYLQGKRPGVPFILINHKLKAIGRIQVPKIEDELKALASNPFPSPYGFPIEFNELDIAGLKGRVSIWTKNRVLVSGKEGDSVLLRRILTTEDISQALDGVAYTKVEVKPIEVSGSKIPFDHAVRIGDWLLQWRGQPLRKLVRKSQNPRRYLQALLMLLMILAFSLFFLNSQRKVSKGKKPADSLKTRWRDLAVASTAIVALVAFFVFAKKISPDALKESGYHMPLPLFTFLIALVDGFNPCNMFVLTCLLAVLIATSSSRVRLYAVAISFVVVVYLFYFTFMAAWLNVFKYVGFIRPLSIGLGIIAILAGLINCKELFFFRKGISLTIQDKHKGPLMRKMDNVKHVIQNGSFPLLISSSIGLATLSSLVELPCTAGFPIIYTGVLAGRGLSSTVTYYLYLIVYNLVYITPLLTIIAILIHTLRARQISQRQMEVIKFIGGIIMLLLGVILLVNPGLIIIGVS